MVDSTLKNKKVTQRLAQVIVLSELKSASKSVGNLLYVIATKTPETIHHHTKFLIDYVVSEQIVKAQQLDEAMVFLTNLVRAQGADAKVEESEFKREAGVGVVVTDEEIAKLVEELFAENMDKIKEQGHAFDFTRIVYKCRDLLKWADQRKVIELINNKKVGLLGEPSKEDGQKKKKAKQPKEEKKEKKQEVETNNNETTTGKILSDIIGRDIVAAKNSEEALRKHREATGGKVMTRFPPEPNGYLHIGHAKAMRFNFTVASENGGLTYLRFDDTNPVKENKEFIDNIKTCVDWLGYKPFKVTYASDYFQQLYDFACELIRKDKAYVDRSAKPDIKEQRAKKVESPFRNTPIDENLKLFEMMKQGRF